MSDLPEVLPDFDLQPYRHLTHSLEKNDITVAELISLDPVEIAKRCPLPLSDLKGLINNVIQAVRNDLSLMVKPQSTNIDPPAENQEDEQLAEDTFLAVVNAPVVKTLDAKIDACLGGGFRTGHITEIVGESAVGKTQFVLGLLLSVQLQPPLGLGKSAIYLSTEAPLNTTRLTQMLFSHPVFEDLTPDNLPSLDRIHTISTNNLETQEHIIRHQVPLAVQRFNVGLIVMDSVAANFRAEHETKNAKSLADRAVDLTKLGNMLRNLAQDHDIAIVVTNQVSDRFDDVRTMQDRIRSSSPITAPSPMQPPKLPSASMSALRDEYMGLDYQQRFFTGWGDQPTTWYEQLKTPALGLSWANQLSARIVLKMESERVGQYHQDYQGGNIWKDKKKRRFLGVVFAPWAPPTLQLVEYEIVSQGAMSVSDQAVAERNDPADQEMLDPSLWLDGAADDEEFP